jgi:hypothetical protein
MRVAYLFTEKYPNYDLDFQLLKRIYPDELHTLDTYIRTGLWDFFGHYQGGGRIHPEIIQKDLASLFFSQDGNLSRQHAEQRLLVAVQSNQIYTIQLYSVGRHLALSLHERLMDMEEYLGFTQVLPQVAMHRQVFDNCIPRYRVERGKIFVLFSEVPSDDEWLADEIIGWLKEHYRTLNDMHIVSAMSKRDIGAKFTILDSSEMGGAESDIQRAVQILRDEWELHAEQTIYRLQDAAPDALGEFTIAVEVLSKPNLSPADCAQIAVSLRRTIEKITEIYCPAEDHTPGWVKRRWEEFVDKQFADSKPYGDYFKSEILGLEDTIGRLITANKMGHKGVHEDWGPRVFRSIVLRMIPLLSDLLSLRSKRTVKLDPRLLYQTFDDFAEEG